MAAIQRRLTSKRIKSPQRIFLFIIIACFVPGLIILSRMQQMVASRPIQHPNALFDSIPPKAGLGSAELKGLRKNSTALKKSVEDTQESCPVSNCQVHVPLDQDTGQRIESQNGDVFLITRKGDKGFGFPGEPAPPNQDRVVLYQSTDKRNVLLMLADGHGSNGHLASQQALDDVPRLLFEKLKSRGNDDPDGIKQSIHESFIEADKGKLQSILQGGSTAIVLLQRGSDIFVASAGDSTAFLAQFDGPDSRIILQARRHKPADPEERARIERLGGTVILPPPDQSDDLSSRVLIGNMALAMSRCLGDVEGKKMGVITPEPTVKHYRLESGTSYFLVAATDGVVDFLNTQDIANLAGKTIFEAGSLNKLQEIATNFMNQAAEQWRLKTQGTYRDDMSLAIAKLEVH